MVCMDPLMRLSLSLAATTTSPPQPDKSYAIWAVILLGIAVVLFFLEVIVPSGGVIGLLSALCTVAGIVMLFRIHTVLGLVGAILSLAAVPFLFFFALRLWPSTPIAQMLLLKQPQRATEQAAANSTDSQGSGPLVGAEGQAMTDLHPVARA